MAVSDSRLVASAIEAGCSGILTKGQGFRELVSAVHLAHVGDVYLAPDVLAGLLPRIDRSYRGLGCDLTEREREVLQLMAAGGLTNKDLASQLHLSPYTVRNHVHNLLAKLGAHSKLEAVVVAAREGLLDGPRRGLSRPRTARPYRRHRGLGGLTGQSCTRAPGSPLPQQPLVVPGAGWFPPPAGTTAHVTRGGVGAGPGRGLAGRVDDPGGLVNRPSEGGSGLHARCTHRGCRPARRSASPMRAVVRRIE